MDLDNIQRKYGLPAPLPVVQNGKFATRFPLNLEHRGDDVFQFGGKYIGEIENIYDLLYKILTNQEIDASLALPYAIKITEDKLYIRDKTNSEWILIFDITKPNFPKEIELYELIYKAITHQVIGEDTSYPGQFKIEENILYVRDKDNLTWTQIGDVTKEFLGATEATQAILEQINEILIEVQELKTELNRQIATTNETLTTALQAANEAMTSAQSINIRTFNSVEEMKASNTLKAGALAKTLGFYTAGDGGGVNYVVTDNIGEDEADEASIIALQKGLYAKLLIKDFVNIKQMGAKGDGETDDTEKIQNTIDKYNNVLIPQGTFKITNGFEITKSNFTIIGLQNSLLKFYGIGENHKMFYTTNTDKGETYKENIIIDGINLDGTNQQYKGGESLENPSLTSPMPISRGIRAVYITNVKNLTVKNCRINEFYGDGIIVEYSTNVLIEKNRLDNCSGGNIAGGGYGIDSFGDGITCFHCYNAKIIKNTVINNRKYLVHFTNSATNEVYNAICGRSGVEFEFNSKNSSNKAPDVDTLDITKNGMLAEGNFIYGYTKALHLEADVICNVSNNFCYHYYCGCMITTEDAIIVKNEFDDKDSGTCPQKGYSSVRADIVVSPYESTSRPSIRNTIIANNRLYGIIGVNIANNGAVITNNLFSNKQYSIVNNTSLENIKDIIIDGNIFYNNQDEFLNYISIYAPLNNTTISNNIFYPLINGSNPFVRFWGKSCSYISFLNNIFNCDENTDTIIRVQTSEIHSNYTGNVINNKNNNTKFTSNDSSIKCIYRDNKLENSIGYLVYQLLSFSGYCEFSGNNGRVYVRSNKPNVNLFGGDNTYDYNFWYYSEGEKYNELAGANTNGDKVHICTKSGYGVYTKWSSGLSVSVTKWVYNSAGKTYSAIAIDGENETIESTVEPTFEEGEQKLADGITWKYIGERAEFDVKTISYV